MEYWMAMEFLYMEVVLCRENLEIIHEMHHDIIEMYLLYVMAHSLILIVE